MSIASTVGLSLGLAVGVGWLAGLLPSSIAQVLFGVTVLGGVVAGIMDDVVHRLP